MISKTLKISIFTIAFASFTFSGAQEMKDTKKPNSERMFKHLDADANGIISLKELKDKRMKDKSKEAQIEKHFIKMDTDENGSIDRKEFEVYMSSAKKRKQKMEKKG